MAELRYDNLYRVLEAYGEEVVDKYREKLVTEGKYASGKLSDTLRSFVEVKGDAVAVYLELEDYWKYLERGTRLQGPYRKQGKRPPLKPFVDWVRYKAIPLRGKKLEQVAWAVAMKVWKEGTKPFWFLRDSLAEIPDIDKRVEEALRADIETYIQEMIAEL